MRIGIVNWELLHSRGGIQKAGIDLANEMQHRGHKTIVFHRSIPKDQTIFPELAPGIDLISLGIESYGANSAQARKLFAHTRTILQQNSPDVLVAMFSWNALLIFPSLLQGTGIPFVISEHNDPKIIDSERWNAYERLACMTAADRIHVLLSSFKQHFPLFLQDRLAVIPNAAPARKTLPPSPAGQTKKTILSAGRFVESHKQFSLLVEAFAKIKPGFPDWNLVICGDGEQMQSYRQLITKLHMGDSVTLPGMVENMDTYYASAHIFCLPSRYEGFGLVLTEAQNYGLPCVAFRECPGPNEIIVHNENGLLCEEMTAAGLASTLQKLMQDDLLRQRMGKKAQEMLSRYDSAAVYDAWEQLLHEASQCRGNTELQRIAAPEYEQRYLENALCEILSRPTPFAGMNRADVDKLAGRIGALERRQKDLEQKQKNIETSKKTITFSEVLRWIARKVS